MSFAVYAVAPGRIDQMVQRAVRRMESRLKRDPAPGSTERRATKARADILSAPPRRRVSGDFETLAGAREYAQLAAASGMEYVAIISPHLGEPEVIDAC